MKKIAGLIAALVIGFAISASEAQATEGNIEISSNKVACEAISVWRDSSYRVTGRCSGLVYPYESQVDHYVIWARLNNGNTVRIDDVERGYFEGSVQDDFENVLVTAESESSPRRPSSSLIVSGPVNEFIFDTSKSTTATPTPTPAASVRPSTSTAGSTVGSVVGRIMRALLVIVVLIIVVAIVASLLFRRRGSVSA